MATNERVFNFSAGPSTLPVEVLEKAAAEMLNYDGTGESVMEMSHRSAEYKQIIEDAEKNLRTLMIIMFCSFRVVELFSSPWFQLTC